MFVIARFEEGISLNAYEYVLTEDGKDLMKFENVNDAVEFINEAHGISNKTSEEWEEEGIYFLNEEDLTK